MKKNVRDTVKELIEPTVTELGYTLWDVTYTKIGADYHLEITIDNERGIGIDDCERVHRAIDPILDEHDPIESFYYLEVSSPGIERELRTDGHIEAMMGREVEAKLFSAKDGRKSIIGILASYEDGTVTLRAEDGDVSLLRSEISRLVTTYREESL
ncbi:MAG: ribosome maturation factor RimP [Clostridia bacterium]|nr:ribosome maturation factor RimP [Clostridia bacterium]